MENSVVDTKNELIEWIENTFDSEILQKVVDLKNDVESSSLVADINSETVIEENFDEQFAAGMSSDELMENVAAHIESIATEKSSTMAADKKTEYVVKDDFDERFTKGITSEKSREESKKKIREWWGK